MWRQQVKIQLQADLEEHNRASLARAAAISRCGAVKVLAQLAGRVVLGQVRCLINRWSRHALRGMIQDLQTAHGEQLERVQRKQQEIHAALQAQMSKQAERAAQKETAMHDAHKHLRSSMDAQGRGAGLRMLRQTIAHAARGELGVHVWAWRMGARNDEMRKLQTEHQRAQKTVQAQLQREMTDFVTDTAEASKGVGLRLLKQIMIRLAKGEGAMRLEVWRQHVKMAALKRHRDLQATLEAQMRAQGQEAGLRALKQVMKRLAKGEAAMRIEIWRTKKQDEVRAEEMARLQRDLEAKAVDATRGAGLRQLKQIMTRHAKGEAGMRVEVWRMAVIMAGARRRLEIQARLEERMQAQGQGEDSACYDRS